MPALSIHDKKCLLVVMNVYFHLLILVQILLLNCKCEPPDSVKAVEFSPVTGTDEAFLTK